MKGTMNAGFRSSGRLRSPLGMVAVERFKAVRARRATKPRRKPRRSEGGAHVAASSPDSVSAVSSSTLPSPERRLNRLEVPCLVARVTPDDVLNSSQSWIDLQVCLRNTLDARSSGRGSGLSAVIMDGSEDANALYEASIKAMEALRDFPSVPLLLNGRPDIAAACGCEGVVLSQTDIPTVAARRILSNDPSKEQSSLVIRQIADAEAARKSAEEGASALITDAASAASGDPVDLGSIKVAQRGAASIPVLLALGDAGAGAASLPENFDDVDGLVGSIETLKSVGAPLLESETASETKFGDVFSNALLSDDQQRQRLAAMSDDPSATEAGTAAAVGGEVGAQNAGKVKIGAVELKLAIEEGLGALMRLVEARAPRLIDGEDGNASILITNALQALSEAILLVIVGEFNSGKSSVINALLRDSFLPTGVVPTTNEVCLIKYGTEAGMEQQEDGTFLKTVPSEMLKKMTIVDTPGTNVVLERQQKLTEDFIPKADLVLFTMSADRALTESETKFMTFIKQWSKKIVFVVNKRELLSQEEIEEVSAFVKKNSSQILGIQNPPVYPVSAKLEMQETGGAESGFGELSQVIESATGGVGAGAKLKFQTALSLGQSLCNALKQQIKVKDDKLKEESRVLEAISKQLKRFGRDMHKDASVQYSNISRSLDSVFSATEELTDSLLSLGNAKDISGYITGARPVKASPSAEILNNFESVLRSAVAEHRGWLLENCNQQCSYYRAFLDEKVMALAQGDNLSNSMDRALWQQEMGSGSDSFELGDLLKDRLEAEEALLAMSSEVLTNVYESSVTEAATTSFGTAGAAVVLTLVSTLILNTIQEDLLVLVFGSVVAYLSVLSIPLQRAKVKFIIRSKLQDYISSLTKAMKKDLEVALGETNERIAAMVTPLEEMIAKEKADLERLEMDQAELEKTFGDLLIQVSALEDEA